MRSGSFGGHLRVIGKSVGNFTGALRRTCGEDCRCYSSFMKTARLTAIAFLAIGSTLALHLAYAQQPGVKRTELQRHDLSAPGRELIQVRVAVDPGVALPMHSHHGEEVVYVLEGTWEFQLEGRDVQKLKAGDVAFVPTGVKHRAKNIGSDTGSVLATYIVEKGKPLVIPAK
jgi:quercetin dioxygenase-like cupin family protein